MSEFSFLLSDQEISKYLSQHDKKQWPMLLKRLVLYSIRSLGALEAAGFSLPAEFQAENSKPARSISRSRKEHTPPVRDRKSREEPSKILNITNNRRDDSTEAKIQRTQQPSYIEPRSRQTSKYEKKPQEAAKKPDETVKRPSYAGCCLLYTSPSPRDS